MSLITNEIHMIDGFRKTLLVFAADRKLTRADGTHGGIKKKLFRIPYLEAGISYFGLAEVYPKGRAQLLSDWLPNFITRNSDITTIRALVFALRNELQVIIPKDTLAEHPSGFHVCGYNSAGIPEFWFLTNIGGMNEFEYTNLNSCYAEPSPDFLQRDAKNLGWDGTNLSFVQDKAQIYRNGDYRAHAYLWSSLDRFMNDMRRFSDFRRLQGAHEYEKWVKFKLEVVAYFYKKFADRKIIGRPIDVFTLSKTLS